MILDDLLKNWLLIIIIIDFVDENDDPNSIVSV